MTVERMTTTEPSGRAADDQGSGEGVYVVYRYDFPDGSAYVGHTRRPLAERHYQHTVRPSNRYLLHQLLRCPDVLPRIVSRHPTDIAAIKAERAETARLERPLNSVWIATQRYVPPGCVPLDDLDPRAWSLMGRAAGGRIRKRTRRYPRATTGLYHCRICLQHKPPRTTTPAASAPADCPADADHAPPSSAGRRDPLGAGTATQRKHTETR